ncbi:VP4 [Dinovernavirus aedis]|uniref:Putative non-structural protein 4 n=1 Tax=Aedes pseudoscutellaris reovirus (isolate France) TaxID=648170 RepID=VP4_APRVF|nr:VP4 [Aedes pseudoscutellaris reovirus]Q2Y0E7.1 RecName: Full=Putative non-structural protein 4; Short=NS4 [Aedes pseudoscutellaris reovirus isolate France]AAZ94071.1 VP4 [Aedes pseudoscutellaris reovirus]
MQMEFKEELCDMFSQIWDHIPDSQNFSEEIIVDEKIETVPMDVPAIVTHSTNVKLLEEMDVEIVHGLNPIKTLMFDGINDDDEQGNVGETRDEGYYTVEPIDEFVKTKTVQTLKSLRRKRGVTSQDGADDTNKHDNMHMMLQNGHTSIQSIEIEHDNAVPLSGVVIDNILNKYGQDKIFNLRKHNQYGTIYHISDVNMLCEELICNATQLNLPAAAVRRITFEFCRWLNETELLKLQCNQLEKFVSVDSTEWFKLPVSLYFDIPIMAKLLNIPYNLIIIREGVLFQLLSLSDTTFELQQVEHLDFHTNQILAIIIDDHVTVPLLPLKKLWNISDLAKNTDLPLDLCEDVSSYFKEEDKAINTYITPYIDPRIIFIAHRNPTDFMFMLPNIPYLTEVNSEIQIDKLSDVCEFEYNRYRKALFCVENLIEIHRWHSLVCFIHLLANGELTQSEQIFIAGISRTNEYYVELSPRDCLYNTIRASFSAYQAWFKDWRANRKIQKIQNNGNDSLHTVIEVKSQQECPNIEQNTSINVNNLFFNTIIKYLDHEQHRFNFSDFNQQIAHGHFEALHASVEFVSEIQITREFCDVIRSNLPLNLDIISLYSKSLSDYLKMDLVVYFPEYNELRLIDATKQFKIRFIEFNCTKKTITMFKYTTTFHASMQKSYNYQVSISNGMSNKEMFITCFKKESNLAVVKQFSLRNNHRYDGIIDQPNIIGKGRPNYPNTKEQSVDHHPKISQVKHASVEQGHLINNYDLMKFALCHQNYKRIFNNQLFSEAPISDESLFRLKLEVNTGQHILAFTHVSFYEDGKVKTTYVTFITVDIDCSHVHQALLPRCVFHIQKGKPILYAANKTFVTGGSERRIEVVFNHLKEYIKETGIRSRDIHTLNSKSDQLITTCLTPFILSSMSMRKALQDNGDLSFTSQCVRKCQMSFKDDRINLPCGTSVHESTVDLHKHACLLEYYRLGLYKEKNNMNRCGFSCVECHSRYPNQLCANVCRLICQGM